MKKLLINLFAGLVLLGFGGTAVAEEIKLPERFKDYRTKANLISYDTFMHKGIPAYYRTHFDLNGDQIADVTEVRSILDIKDGILYVQENPISYWFDINQDKKTGDDEVIQDPKEDGWNGNETWYKPRTN
jgi:hypothetical protein